MVHSLPNLFTLKDHFKESQLYLNRTVTATVIVCLLFFILIVRLVYLQIDQHDVYKTMSLHNQVRMVPMVPPRGLIFDRNGVLLAENAPAFSLEITPERTPDIASTLKAIDQIMPLTEEEQRQFNKQLKYKRRNEGIPVRVKLTEAEVARFSVEKHHLPGVDIVARLIRHYPFGEKLGHVLGYIGPISEKDLTEIDPGNYRGTYYIGKVGLEKYYETLLHGKTGYQHLETDAKGRTIRFLRKVPPTSGANLYLSLDSHLQLAAFEALKDLKGAIVAIDPRTGEILALVSTPSFDPNLFTQGIDAATYQVLQNSPDRPLFNRAIKGQYPPGSTIKPLVAIQGLEIGVINTQTRLFDPGWYQLNNAGRLYRDWIYFSKRHGHGWVDLDKAMSQSCDTYFFTLAHKLGVRHMHDIYTRFGIGKVTHVDVTGESSGLAPSAEWKKKVYNQDWFAGDTLNIGIGQGYLLATPLQLAQMTAIIANKGKYYKPHLVSAIEFDHSNNPIKQPLKPMPPIMLKNPEHWNIVIQAMKNVVHIPGGTAYRISRDLKYQMAGKTGTAQVFSLKQNEKYEVHKVKVHLRDHSWFIAFAPLDDPKIALAVLVENKKTKSGADVARVVLDSFFNNASATETSDTTGEDESTVGGEEETEEETLIHDVL